jgi:hypothetical protein
MSTEEHTTTKTNTKRDGLLPIRGIDFDSVNVETGELDPQFFLDYPQPIKPHKDYYEYVLADKKHHDSMMRKYGMPPGAKPPVKIRKSHSY